MPGQTCHIGTPEADSLFSTFSNAGTVSNAMDAGVESVRTSAGSVKRAGSVWVFSLIQSLFLTSSSRFCRPHRGLRE